MFIVSKALSYRVLQWLFAQGKPFGWTPLLRGYLVCVVPSLYSGVFCTRAAWVCLLLCKEDGSSPVSFQLLRGGIWAYVSQLQYVMYYVVVKCSLNILVRNASPRGPMCFRCLIFSLSGHCELLFLLCFISSWIWEGVSVMLHPCMFCVVLSMDLFNLCVA